MSAAAFFGCLIKPKVYDGFIKWVRRAGEASIGRFAYRFAVGRLVRPPS